MFTAKVTAQALKQINDKIDDIIKNIREKSNKLLGIYDTYDKVSSELYNFIVQSCESECKLISSSIYFDLYNQISNSSYFRNPELVNEFYSLDMRNYLADNCKFELENQFSYSPKDMKKVSMTVGGGIAIVGSVLSLLLSSPIGIIPSVIVGGISYPITYKITDKKNFENYIFSVELYLKNLKKKFTKWIEQFEEYYSQTMEDLIQKCKS